MKRILLIILLSFLSVIGAIGLVVGGMFLFGGFDEKSVYAESIEFNRIEVIESKTFALKITTPTENVTKKRLRLFTNNGNSSNVIDFPEYVEIGEVFTIVPKQVKNINVGGNVTLYANYDDSGSNEIAPAKCEILIDVPVEKATIAIKQTQTKPNLTYTIATKGESIFNLISVYPQDSLIPYLSSGNRKIDEILDKTIFLELTDETGNALSTNVAQFKVNETEQLTNVIELRYKFDKELNKIVFEDNISFLTKNVQGDVKLNVYIYATYEQQSKNLNEESEVLFVKNNLKTSSCYFAVGNYVVSNMTCDTTDKEVLIDLSDGSDSAINIYVNSNKATSKDINLGVELQTNSENIEVSQVHLYNLYLSIDNSNYRLLFNNGSLEDENNSAKTDEEAIKFYYDGLSSDKNDWCWRLKLNKFLGYYNYSKTATPFVATLKYIEYEKDNNGLDTNVVKLELTEKTFNIIPTIIETTDLEVKYKEAGDTSFNVRSGEKIDFVADSSKYQISPSNATFKDLTYYLSYAENDSNVSIIPKKLNKNYKATFSFTLDEAGIVSNPLSCANLSWCNISSVEFIQGEKHCYINYPDGGTIAISGNTNFVEDTKIDAIVYFKLLSLPTEENLFKIDFTTNSGTKSKYFSDFEIKFFEYVYLNDDGYDLIPFLEVNGIRVYLDYDFYFDENTNSKYLKLNFEGYTGSGNYQNLYKAVGIGSFVITAQLTFTDSQTVYWLEEYEKINISVFEELEDLTVYKSFKDNSWTGFSEVDEDKINLSFNENILDKNYIYLTSSTMETLKNYINNNQIFVSVKQVFEGLEGISNYTNIYNTNKDAIVFDDVWVAIYDNNDLLVGFKLGYTIGEVCTMKVDGDYYSPKFEITIKANVNGSDKTAKYFVTETELKDKMFIDVKDKLLEKATIRYNNNVYTEENPLKIVATVDGNGNISYSSFDKDKLTYYFEYNDESHTKTAEILQMTPDADVSLEGIYSFVKSNECKGGLTLGNFPRKKDSEGKYSSGVKLKLKISASSPSSINTYFNYDNNSLEKYDLTDELWIEVYGLVVEITNNESAVFYGKKNEKIDLFNNSNGLFKISVKSGNEGSLIEKTVNNYSKILKVSYLNDSIGNDTFVLNDSYTQLTSNVDFVDDKDFTFKFFVGNNSIKNAIKIGELDSCVKKINSPFIINNVKTSFDAPATKEVFLTLWYGESPIDLTKTDIKLEYLVLNDTITLSSSYNIVSPILVSDNKNTTFTAKNPYSLFLTLKEIPEIYTAQIKVWITLTEGEQEYYKEKIYTITILSKFSSNNVTVGTNDEIVAGSNYVVNSGITLSGLFSVSEGNWLEKVSNVKIDYEDVVENPIVEAKKHMEDSDFSSETKLFSIYSYDLSEDKQIKCKFQFDFVGGGKTIIEKIITIKKNLSLKFAFDGLYNGSSIDLNSNIYYKLNINNEDVTFDINNYFNFKNEQQDNIYNEDSFVFDSNVFTENKNGTTYSLTVNNGDYDQGGNVACQGQTTIIVKYAVLEGETVKYTMPISIKLNIYPNEIKIGDYLATTRNYFIDCGEDNKVNFADGLILSGSLLTNKNNIKNVQIEFIANNGNEQTLVNNLLHYNVSYLGEGENKTLSDIEIYATDYNKDVKVKIKVTLLIGNTQYYYYEVVTFKANVELDFIVKNIYTTDQIDLSSADNFDYIRNNETVTGEDKENFVDALNFVFDSTVFELDGTNLKVKQSFINSLIEITSFKTEITVKKYFYSITEAELYCTSFNFEIKITKA